MEDNWKQMDENDLGQELKQAVAVYQSIKAPSSLREKVLQGSETGPRYRAVTGKIHKAGMLAACLVIMVVSVHIWTAEEDPGALLPDEAQSPQTVELAENVITDAATDGKSENGADDGISDVEDFEEKTGKTVQATEANVETGAAAGEVATKLTDTAPQNGKDGEAVDSGENTERTIADVGRTAEPAAVSVCSLLPSVLIQGENVGDWEIRLVEAEEESCTLEISQGDQMTTLLLAKGEAEDGSSQWSIENAGNKTI